MGEFIWVKNESTGHERKMTKTSFKYNESKRGAGNNLRPKFKYLREVEEPKSEVQQHMERLKAEKAAKEAQAPVTSTEPATTEAQAETKTPAKRGPKPKNV